MLASGLSIHNNHNILLSQHFDVPATLLDVNRPDRFFLPRHINAMASAQLYTRADGAADSTNPKTTTMLIVAIVLAVCACIACAALATYWWTARSRQRRQNTLPLYKSDRLSVTGLFSRRREDDRVKPHPSIFVHKERQNLLASSAAPPPPESPEIRITLPDAHNAETGQTQSGEVVVIHIGDRGLPSPHHNGKDELPPYQNSDAERFQSLDIDRIGGLKEKDPLIS